jgi:hypothetical protein
MNTTLSTAPGRHDHPPHVALATRPVRRVGLIDRLALHIGVALVAWSRRPRTVESRERRANRVEHELARIARERAAERELRLSIPIR